jgi:hypothetical protein
MAGFLGRLRRHAASPDAPSPPAAPAIAAPATAAPVDAAPPSALPEPSGSALTGDRRLVPARPGFRERAAARRRLRYLRRVRELALRDLGGLVFDLDRFGRARPDLVRAKLDALTAIDRQVRTLEIAVDDVRAVTELHEPGVASCPRCGELNGSEARFCSTCGSRMDARPGDASARGPADVGADPVGARS